MSGTDDKARAVSVTNLLEGWAVEPPIEFAVGETYIVRANHDKGFWADFLITITEKTDNGDWGCTLDTILDGSPGILEGYTGRDTDER